LTEWAEGHSGLGITEERQKIMMIEEEITDIELSRSGQALKDEFSKIFRRFPRNHRPALQESIKGKSSFKVQEIEEICKYLADSLNRTSAPSDEVAHVLNCSYQCYQDVYLTPLAVAGFARNYEAMDLFFEHGASTRTIMTGGIYHEQTAFEAVASISAGVDARETAMGGGFVNTLRKLAALEKVEKERGVTCCRCGQSFPKPAEEICYGCGLPADYINPGGTCSDDCNKSRKV
jgi:hypothetical protein